MHLKETEAIGVWLSTALAQRARGLPFGRAAKRGIDKIIAGLPSNRRASPKKLTRRIVVSPAATRHMAETSGSPPEKTLFSFEEAFAQSRCLDFSYVDRNELKTHRQAEPHGLLIQWPIWYAISWCLARQAPRLFRMDRMSRCQLFSQPIETRSVNIVATMRSLFEKNWQK